MKERNTAILFRLFGFFAFLMLLGGSALTASPASASGRCYVNDDASGANNGTSWADAYTSLQSGIVDTCAEIWVAAGTYKPHASDRTVSFNIEEGLSIYGGFAGTESLLSERDIAANPTILSGDLNGNDNGIIAHDEPTRGDNSYHVLWANTIGTAVLDGFTITGGNANANVNGNDRYGGGMFNNYSSITFNNLTFRENTSNLSGAGIYNGNINSTTNANSTFSNSTFYNNHAVFGGGMANYNSSPALTNITFSGNSAEFGGGIHNNGATATYTNLTFSGNSASTSGGGISIYNGTITLNNVIITNSTAGGNCFIGSGGFINSASNNNLISDASCSLTDGDNGNMIGASYDADLGSLADNGGPSLTHALLSGSDAINTGTSSGAPAQDQRGVSRPQNTSYDIGAYELLYCDPGTFDNGQGICELAPLGYFVSTSGATQSTACPPGYYQDLMGSISCKSADEGYYVPFMGSAEQYACPAGTNTTSIGQAVCPQTGAESFIVNSNADTNDGVCSVSPNNCTLREAIIAANAKSGADTITFASNYTITLGGSQLPIVSTEITITGNGATNTIIQSNENFNAATNRVFEVNSIGALTLDGVTIRNGRCNGSCPTSTDNGGGIYNQGTLTVKNSALSGNNASSNGGAIYNNGTFTLENSTLSGNTATTGGGVYSNNGTINITNSTFSGNITTNEGGGLSKLLGAATITNTTFAENTSQYNGANLASYAGTTTLKNTIIANRAGGTSECLSNFGTLTADTTNIDTDGSCDNAVQKTPSELNIGPLQNNGGLTQTYALLPGSAAIDAGTSTGAPTEDQRGVSRSQGTTHDVGAFEYENARRYAVPSGLTSGNCASWVDACELNYAISSAIPGDQVWVKQGEYQPDDSNRAISFVLKNGVEIYGGFGNGDETSLNQRNPYQYLTILSGEIGDTNDATDNSSHVVNASGVDNTAILDGFFITEGYASDGDANTSTDDDNGGGLFANNGSPTLRNLTFSNNYAEYGGGISTFVGSPVLSNVTFANNSATDGGGLSALNSSPSLTNVTFSGNSAVNGGALHLQSGAHAALTNVTLANNTATAKGGGINIDDSSSPILKNVIVWANTAPTGEGIMVNDAPSSAPEVAYSIVQNGFDGIGNLNIDPLLQGLTYNGGTTMTIPLGQFSPAIDAGTSAGCPATDQRGVTRGTLCDIGAYELNKSTVTFTSIAAQDGWILESAETSNKGGKLNSGGSTINIGDNAANRQYRAILSFNTELPNGAVITKATLRFKYAGKTGTLPFSTHGKLLVDVKNGAFSNNPALAKGDFNAGANKNALFSLGKSTSWFTKVFTASQLTYINTSGMTQFRLRFTKDDNNDLGADFLKIHSGSAGSNAPQLIIEYYVP